MFSACISKKLVHKQTLLPLKIEHVMGSSLRSFMKWGHSRKIHSVIVNIRSRGMGQFTILIHHHFTRRSTLHA